MKNIIQKINFAIDIMREHNVKPELLYLTPEDYISLFKGFNSAYDPVSTHEPKIMDMELKTYAYGGATLQVVKIDEGESSVTKPIQLSFPEMKMAEAGWRMPLETMELQEIRKYHMV